MPNLTANYKFKKPLQSERVDINVLNENFDNIDKEIKKVNNGVEDINNSKGAPSGFASLDDKCKVPAIQLNKGVDNLVSTSGSGKTTLLNLDIKKYNYIEIFVRCNSSGSWAEGSSVLLNDEEISMNGDSYMLQISSNGQIFGQNQTSNNGDDYYSHMRYIKTIVLKENNTLTIDTKNYASGYKNVKGYY